MQEVENTPTSVLFAPGCAEEADARESRHLVPQSPQCKESGSVGRDSY